MTIPANVQDLLRPEPKRDRWGRYIVAGSKGGKGKGYTRVTTLTKTCSDTFGLTEWIKRVVAVGIAKRPDLIAEAANLTVDDKGPLKEIIAAAEEVGGANEKRRLGTALHKILEIIDLGGDAVVPADLAPHIAAYQAAMTAAGVKIIPEHTEQVFIHDTLEYAGTADRIVTVPGFDLPLIADLKTGKDPLAFGAGEISMQLACYAHGEHVYDYATGERAPMPAVDQEWGLVIHLSARPEGDPSCTLSLVDLRPGWAALDLAMQVRAWRKTKGLHHKLNEHTFTPREETSDNAKRTYVRDRLVDLVDLVVGRGQTLEDAKAKIAAVWPPDVPGFGGDHTHTAEQLDAIDAVLAQLEAKVGAPFATGNPDATPPAPKPAPAPLPEPPATIPNGEPIDNGTVDALRSKLAKLNKRDHATLDAWREEGAWPATSPVTQRQYEITRAAWLAVNLDDDTVRHLLSVAHGEDIQPAVRTVQAYGALTIKQAQQFADLAQAVASGAQVVSFDGAGRPAVAAA